MLDATPERRGNPGEGYYSTIGGSNGSPGPHGDAEELESSTAVPVHVDSTVTDNNDGGNSLVVTIPFRTMPDTHKHTIQLSFVPQGNKSSGGASPTPTRGRLTTASTVPATPRAELLSRQVYAERCMLVCVLYFLGAPNVAHIAFPRCHRRLLPKAETLILLNNLYSPPKTSRVTTIDHTVLSPLNAAMVHFRYIPPPLFYT